MKYWSPPTNHLSLELYNTMVGRPLPTSVSSYMWSSLYYSKDPVLREPAESGGSHLLAPDKAETGHLLSKKVKPPFS